MNLHTPICDLFGIEHPIFLAGMGEVAYAKVCAAVSEAGGFGTLGMVGASPERIREEMRAVRRLTPKPFGVDLLAALEREGLVVRHDGSGAYRLGPAGRHFDDRGAGLGAMRLRQHEQGPPVLVGIMTGQRNVPEHRDHPHRRGRSAGRRARARPL